MKVKLRVFGYLAEVFDKEFIMIEINQGAKIKDLIKRLADNEGKPIQNYLKSFDDLGRDLVILINGHNIHTLNKLNSPLNDGDIVTFLPPVAGGSNFYII